MSEEVTQEECKVRYVYLEMILNRETKYDVVSGLFKGILQNKGDTFILLHGLKDSTAVLNTKFYNIMSIEVLEEEYKNMTYLTVEPQDQEMGSQILAELYDLLIKSSFGIEGDTKIIDIEKYKDVPDSYKDGKPITSNTIQSTPSAKNSGSFNPPTSKYKPSENVVGSFNKMYAAKPDPEPSIIARSKTKRPAKTDLDLMREKIDQIKSGKYVAKLPETLGGEVSAAIDDKSLDDDRDLYAGYYG
jgi:hypothetical protein